MAYLLSYKIWDGKPQDKVNPHSSIEVSQVELDFLSIA